MPIREQARARARAARCGRPGACQPSGALTRGAPGSVVANFSPLPKDTTELKDGDLVKMCVFASRLPMQRRRHPLMFCMFGLPGRMQQCTGLRPTQPGGADAGRGVPAATWAATSTASSPRPRTRCWSRLTPLRRWTAGRPRSWRPRTRRWRPRCASCGPGRTSRRRAPGPPFLVARLRIALCAV